MTGIDVELTPPAIVRRTSRRKCDNYADGQTIQDQHHPEYA
ncbi:hypothetical protein OHA21_06950 [Actinoplanes sp. NBC_00393]